jgi:hypothetical protein
MDVFVPAEASSADIQAAVQLKVDQGMLICKRQWLAC